MPSDNSSPITPRALNLTPLAAELAILLEVVGQQYPIEEICGLRIPCSYIATWQALIALGGHGKAQFAAQTQYLIDQFPSTELVVCAGDALPGVRVVFGTIASGDEDVVSTQRAVAIRTQTDALCVAWEGSGGARAAALSGVGSLEVRAITDSANKAAPSDFAAHLPVAMSMLAQVLTALFADANC